MAPALGGPISIFSELASQSEATSRGKNLIIEQRLAECRYERMPGSAAELVQAPIDVLFTMGARAARIVAETVKTTPLVVYSCDPFEHVTRLARGRGKLTGVTCLTTELSPKRLELLHDAVPTVSRVMFLHDPQAAPNAWKMTEEAAPRLGITLQQAQVGAAEEPLPELAMIAKQRPDALFVSRRRSQLLSSASQVAEFAIKVQLPMINAFRFFTEAGGLMSYGATASEIYTSAAEQVAKILGGTPPSELPLREATRFELVINNRTAKALRLTCRRRCWCAPTRSSSETPRVHHAHRRRGRPQSLQPLPGRADSRATLNARFVIILPTDSSHSRLQEEERCRTTLPA